MMTQNKSHSTNLLKYLIILMEDDGVAFATIEEAPVFPGCSGSNEELRKCFSIEIQKHVSENFKTFTAEALGMEKGSKQRVFVLFTVDKKGRVTNIKVRGPHELLEQEAIRVIKLLPRMKPGKTRGKVIKVKYALPITMILDKKNKLQKTQK